MFITLNDDAKLQPSRLTCVAIAAVNDNAPGPVGTGTSAILPLTLVCGIETRCPAARAGKAIVDSGVTVELGEDILNKQPAGKLKPPGLCITKESKLNSCPGSKMISLVALVMEKSSTAT